MKRGLITKPGKTNFFVIRRDLEISFQYGKKDYNYLNQSLKFRLDFAPTEAG